MTVYDRAVLDIEASEVVGAGDINILCKVTESFALPSMSFIVLKNHHGYEAICTELELSEVGWTSREARDNLETALEAEVKMLFAFYHGNAKATAERVMRKVVHDTHLKAVLHEKYEKMLMTDEYLEKLPYGDMDITVCL